MSHSAKEAFHWPQEFPGAYFIDQREEEAVLNVLRQGSLFRYYGLKPPTQVAAYESAACKFYGVKHALAVNSGTGALYCALSALGLGPGAEVVIPAFLWVATVAAVVQTGAIPVLGEIDESFSLDPTKLEAVITPRTRLILPVHMAGSPCALERILAIAQKHGIPVLEDCAQANGGSYRGRMLGTFGAMGIFSLQLNKNMTSGEGGLIVSPDERLMERAFAAHDMGLLRENGRLVEPPAYALSWGQGRRMGELCGAVARVQLEKLPLIIAQMRASHQRMSERLINVPGLKLRQLNDREGDAGSCLIMMLDDEATARTLLLSLKNGGIRNAVRLSEYGPHIYSNITALVTKTPLSSAGNPWSLPENRDSVFDYRQGSCPQSDALFVRSVLLPIPPCLTLEQERIAVGLIQGALRSPSPRPAADLATSP